MVVQIIEQMHREEGLSYRDLCHREGVSHTSFMRWRERCQHGKSPVARPGPAKVVAMDLGELREEVRAMHHRRHRTAGTGELYDQHRNEISR